MRKLAAMLGVVGFALASTGGPDAYGYTWIDSNEPDGPTYNWIDITTNGTQLQGLGDDGYIGPIPLGFDFPYYWYTSDKIWVHFNGAITFSDPKGQMFHPQAHSSLPSTIKPNDMVVFMGGDLDFTIGGEAWFYTNNQDTAIISFINVPEWNDQSSAHTAQVILYKDASGNGHILVQYGRQVGGFDNGGTDPTSLAGIENITGQVGLMYYRNLEPDSGLAVLYIRPDTSSYEFTNIAVEKVWYGHGVHLHLNTQYPTPQPTVTIKNIGTVDLTGPYTVIFTIRNFNGTAVWADTQEVNQPLAPGEEYEVQMGQFNPSAIGGVGTYSMDGAVSMSGDQFPSDNYQRDIELRVIDWNTNCLAWDNDRDTVGFTWWIGGAGGDAGWGARFILPDSMHIDSVIAYAASAKAAGGQVTVALYDDVNGWPGNEIASQTFNVPGDQNIYILSLPVDYNAQVGEVLYGVVFQETDSTGIGVDDSGPFSLMFLEYTGTWALYRDAGANDVYIRICGSYLSTKEGKPQGFALVSFGPNPVKRFARLSFSLPAAGLVKLGLYDAAGRAVMVSSKNMEAGLHTWSLDLSSLPKGVYIWSLEWGGKTLRGKLTKF